MPSFIHMISFDIFTNATINIILDGMMAPPNMYMWLVFNIRNIKRLSFQLWKNSEGGNILNPR